eukprot:Seg4283.1 transcript_id=Seg4283.1/GoldUCD/mRNA.D3Y31 product="Riboflavin-binding protein" protein_id=Seg4283.1/GoldUCD/D3Y31
MLMYLLLLFSLGQMQAEKCLSGPYHLNQSSPMGSSFVECLNYKKDACCTGKLTQTIKNHPEKLYNFTWHHCNMISKNCLRYLKNEECFYQCDPTLIKYQRSRKRPDAVRSVPICSNYCSKWFDACKDDSTCVENWETGFVKVGEQYACPNTSKCRTFKKVYKNSAGLCNKMWGVSFYYNDANTSCYTMDSSVKIPGAASKIPLLLSTFLAMLTTLVLLFDMPLD